MENWWTAYDTQGNR